MLCTVVIFILPLHVIYCTSHVGLVKNLWSQFLNFIGILFLFTVACASSSFILIVPNHQSSLLNSPRICCLFDWVCYVVLNVISEGFIWDSGSVLTTLYLHTHILALAFWGLTFVSTNVAWPASSAFTNCLSTQAPDINHRQNHTVEEHPHNEQNVQAKANFKSGWHKKPRLLYMELFKNHQLRRNMNTPKLHRLNEKVTTLFQIKGRCDNLVYWILIRIWIGPGPNQPKLNQAWTWITSQIQETLA